MSHEEVDRRYRLVREAMAEHHLDAVLVCGSEYSGFEGAVTYLSGFVVVHRYAYVLLPREGDPTIIFPTEARYVGEHGTSWIEDQVFVDRPGEYIGDRVAGHEVAPDRDRPVSQACGTRGARWARRRSNRGFRRQ